MGYQIWEELEVNVLKLDEMKMSPFMVSRSSLHVLTSAREYFLSLSGRIIYCSYENLLAHIKGNGKAG